MKIVYTIIFFVIYHFILNFFLNKISVSNTMLYLRKSFTLSVLCFGILIPILILMTIMNFENYNNLGFIIAISFIYTKIFFNYKILKNDTKN